MIYTEYAVFRFDNVLYTGSPNPTLTYQLFKYPEVFAGPVGTSATQSFSSGTKDIQQIMPPFL